MKSASVLCLFALLLTACASTGGHRLIREEVYEYGTLSCLTTYQYEEGELVGKTTVYYFKDFNWDDHIDTICYSYQTNKVGDNIEEITYRTEIRKDTVIKYKSVLSGGTYSEYTYVGDEWVEDDRYRNDDVSGITIDSVTYSSDSLQATHLLIYRTADIPDKIMHKYINRYDHKGRKIREYTEELRLTRKIAYNRHGLEKKTVDYDVKDGRTLRVRRAKWKYDRKTGYPLKLTSYSIYGYGISRFRKPTYKTIWTYE